MILNLVSYYKTEDNPYANSFVHTRVMSYLKAGIESEVFVLNEKKSETEYDIDGVHVIVGAKDRFKSIINQYEKLTVCIHFIDREMIKMLSDISISLNLVIFVHGNEALHWYERIFPGVFYNLHQTLAFCKYAFYNIKSIKSIKNFLANTHHKCSFVTVSNWMKDAAEKSWDCVGKYDWNIIPNVVDLNRFKYCEKTVDDRINLLSIRPFGSGKYANDITAKLITKLSGYKEFDKINFTWVGDGRLYDKTVKPVLGYKNVKLIRKMLPQSEIPNYHKKAGIFITPTRQDAQGVSMCEAMSSGLVPITLYNTAIPEFLPDDNRLFCENVDDMVNLVLYLINNPEEYLELSKKCNKFISEKCCEKNTTEKELELIRKLIEV